MECAGKVVCVAGNTGAGKSTLLETIGERLSEVGFKPELADERAFHHPHVMLMFERPEVWAFPIQVNFILERTARLLRFAEVSTPQCVLVMERSLWEDPLFFEYYVSRNDIGEAECAAYHALLAQFQALTPRPDVVLYLQAESEEAFRRLERASTRGDRPVELTGEALRRYIIAMDGIYRRWSETVAAKFGRFLVVDAQATSDVDGAVREVVDTLLERTG